MLEEFAEAQSWVHADIASAELRYASRLQQQRERWEETRRWKLKTDPAARARRVASCSKYEKKKWLVTRADPAKRAAHNAKRMAAYYRKKERLQCLASSA